MTRLFAAFVFLFCAVQAQAQTAVLVNSGEHPTFSRLVFPAADNVTYSVLSNKRTVTVSLEGFGQKFDLSRVFDRIPKTRLLSVEQSQGSDSAELVLNLACDCLGLAYRMNRYLVVDVIDGDDARFVKPEPEVAEETKPEEPARERPLPRTPQREVVEATEITPKETLDRPLLSPKPETAVDDEAKEPAEEAETVSATSDNQVEEARRTLMKQLELAAEQGLVALSDPPKDSKPDEEAKSTENTLENELKSLSAEMQAEGSIRIRRPKQKRESDMPPVEGEDTPDILDCVPDNRLDPENWADDRSFNAQLVDLRVNLLGEFDQPNPQELENLVKFYLHYGLAIEAEQLLRSYKADFPDRQILQQVSDILRDTGALNRDLFGAADCGDRAGLWRAMASDTAEIVDRASEDSILTAYGELPTMLRDVLATKLIDRLLVSDRTDLAETLLSINERSPRAIQHELMFLKAKLLARKGQAEEAQKIYTNLVARNLPNHQSALVELGGYFLETGNIPAEFLQDLKAASYENRDTELGRQLFQSLLLAQATVGELDLAFDELRLNGNQVLGSTAKTAALAAELFSIALESPMSEAKLVETSISQLDLMDGDGAADQMKSQLAERMSAIGLPNLSLQILDHVPRSESNRSLTAKALLKTGRSQDVEDELGSINTKQSRIMRAQAFTEQGLYSSAKDELSPDDDPELLANLAWLSEGTLGETENIQQEKPDRKALSEFLLQHDEKEIDLEASITNEELRYSLETVRKTLSLAARVRETTERIMR